MRGVDDSYKNKKALEDKFSYAELVQGWARICKTLEYSLGEQTVCNWFRKIVFVGLEPYAQATAKVVLSAPTRFVRDWVLMHYGSQVEECWEHVHPEIVGIEIIVGKEEVADASTLFASKPIKNVRGVGVESLSTSPEDGSEALSEEYGRGEQMTLVLGEGDLSTPLDERMTFDNFMSCPANEIALCSARRLLDSQGATSFNPLFIYSAVGLGKTHLMQALACAHREKYRSRVIYFSAEKFMYHFIKALRANNVMPFKEKIRSADLLLIDDVQFIGGKETTQNEFFQTFNALVEQRKQIVLSADRAPTRLEDIGERIKSRLSGGLCVDIQNYDASARLKILHHKIDAGLVGADARWIDISALEFLAHHMQGSVRDLEGALRRLVAYAGLLKKKIYLTQAETILRDILQAQAIRSLSVQQIQEVVANFYGLSVNAMTSSRRHKSLTRARHIAIYLARSMTQESLPSIGKRFGNRGHATVIYALRRIQEAMGKDGDLVSDVERITQQLMPRRELEHDVAEARKSRAEKEPLSPAFLL